MSKYQQLEDGSKIKSSRQLRRDESIGFQKLRSFGLKNRKKQCRGNQTHYKEDQMNELIKVNYDSDRPTVLGRDLHEMLEVKSKYADWIKNMIEYGFTENTDFITLSKNLENGGRVKDHQLTIEMAKELCMIQRTEKGKQARQYFIQLEEAWNRPEMVMARALKMAERKIGTLESTIEDNKPKVLFADAVAASHTSILIGDLAKLIRQNGVDIGQNRLFEWLRKKGYIQSRGEARNMPTQYSMDRGLFEIKERTINNPDGSIKTTKTPKVTGKGQQYFIQKFLL